MVNDTNDKEQKCGWVRFNERRALARKLQREAKAEAKAKAKAEAVGCSSSRRTDCRQRPSRWSVLNAKKAMIRAEGNKLVQRCPVPPRIRLRGKQSRENYFDEDKRSVAEWMNFNADCLDLSTAARCAHLAKFSQSKVAKRAMRLILEQQMEDEQEQGASSSSSSSLAQN